MGKQVMQLPQGTLNKLLLSKQYQGTTNNCGPCSAATILNAFSILKLSGIELGQSLNKISWNGVIPLISRIPNWATFPWGVANALKQHGLYAKWQIFSNPETLESFLKLGIIQIVLVSPARFQAHYKIFAGVSEDRYGFIDSAYPQKELTWEKKEHFLSGWNWLGRQRIIVNSPKSHLSSQV